MNFRLSKDKTSYELIKQCTLYCENMTFNCDTDIEVTEDCFWNVKNGDRICVAIYQNCSANYDDCPLHINLNAGNECYSALYYEDIYEDNIPVQYLKQLHILLNLKVWIRRS